MGALDPYTLDDAGFKTALAERTTTADVFANAERIYERLTELFGTDCNDSVLREWAFQWWSDQTGNDYDTIYDKWLAS